MELKKHVFKPDKASCSGGQPFHEWCGTCGFCDRQGCFYYDKEKLHEVITPSKGITLKEWENG